VKKTFVLFLTLSVFSFVTACGSSTDTSPEAGQNLALQKGCIACHSVDDTTKIAPPWRGLYGSEIELNDGSTVTVDEEYLIESIKEPNAKIVEGFTRGAMPPISLTDEEIDAIVAYIKSVE